MKKKLFVLVLLMQAVLSAGAQDMLDSLQSSMALNSQVQEKVYVHTDNNCYFIGDTIWYKAYVVRADNLQPTDMSKVLYVELLSPDGLLVQRQRVIIGNNSFTNGQFALTDSLYSGYYEIRAYTRWMLNFNVSERRYDRVDRRMFYTHWMAKDFFRDWDGLCSRVLPVYSKPENEGDYATKRMYWRPKQEIEKPRPDKLYVAFYPEGGHLVKGVPCRVAFEITDQYGKALDLEGSLDNGQKLKATHMGRGVVELTSGDRRAEATFRWKDKSWKFKLPEPEDNGISLRLDKGILSLSSAVTEKQPVAVAWLCRGRLEKFDRLTMTDGKASLPLPGGSLATGINEALVFDSEARPVASRLFFVNHHDLADTLTVTMPKIDYEPFEPVRVELGASSKDVGGTVSVSIRDKGTEDDSYDDGNVMTDMLLSGDLRGFVAYPSWYFRSDSPERKDALDVLMMVQGWRKYRPEKHLRYTPETSLTVEGTVYKQLGIDMLEIDDMADLNNTSSVFEQQLESNDRLSGMETGNTMAEQIETSQIGNTASDDNSGSDGAASSSSSSDESDTGALTSQNVTNDNENLYEEVEFGSNHNFISKPVLVEAELNVDGKVVGAVTKTDSHGHFLFQLPAFYDKGILFMKAYNEKDSAKKSMAAGRDKHFLDEEWYPDYYVKQDLFYPVFTHPYSWYQRTEPDWQDSIEMEDDSDEDTPENSTLEGEHQLATVKVKGRRRGRRSVDYTKPAYVVDAYDLYNEATDRGLSWGVVNMAQFVKEAAFTVYGNMNRYRSYNILGRLDDYTFYRNFTSVIEPIKNRSDASIFNDLHLRRIANVRFYTDYEPRNADSLMTQSLNREDVVVEYETFPDNAVQHTYRDRRWIFDGFAFPEDFYSPDYSQRRPQDAKDYRRTLYWNPNARFDADGKIVVNLYNNGKTSRIKVEAMGVTPDGRFLLTDGK